MTCTLGDAYATLIIFSVSTYEDARALKVSALQDGHWLKELRGVWKDTPEPFTFAVRASAADLLQRHAADQAAALWLGPELDGQPGHREAINADLHKGAPWAMEAIGIWQPASEEHAKAQSAYTWDQYTDCFYVVE